MLSIGQKAKESVDVHVVRREGNGTAISTLLESLQNFIRIVDPVASRVNDTVWATFMLPKSRRRYIGVRRRDSLQKQQSERDPSHNERRP